MKRKIIVMIALVLVYFTGIGFRNYQKAAKPWPVPEKSANVANPVKSNDESIKEGKALYTKHCQSCHGKTGLGDGTKAAQLDTECGDFSKAEFQKQTDGAIFYKTSEGRDDMPSFKKKITETDELWQIVNYVRTLKK